MAITNLPSERICRRLGLGKGLAQVGALKIGRQRVQSASPTRRMRDICPHLTQTELSGGLTASEVWPSTLPSPFS